MKYVCCWSGGKDSTASIILAHLHNEPLDVILMAEVMYDNKRDISLENPEHIKWVREYAKPLFESWGYRVEIVRDKRDYLDLFNRVIKHPRKHMEHKGLCSGFPISGLCSLKRDLKMNPIKLFKRNLSKDDIYTDYVGIAVDEKVRLNRLHNRTNEISLLEKYGYTEQMAKELCEEYNLLSPSYKYTKRNGCWACPNAKLEEFRLMKNMYPDIWKEFVALEDRTDIAFDKFNAYSGRTLKEIDSQLSD